MNDPTTDGLNDTQAGTTLTLSGGNVVAAFADSGSTAQGNHRTGYAVSTDGGVSFTDRGALPASAAGDGSNAVLATDSATGRVYMATMTFTGRDQLQLFRSDDGGVTFGPPVNPTPGFATNTNQLLDRLWLTVDNFPGGSQSGQGNVYLVWKHFGGPLFETTYLSRSTDGGATWAQADITVLGECAAGPFLTVAPDHSVLMACLRNVGSAYWRGSIRFRRSTDQGATFSPAVTVADLRSDGANGNLQLWGGFRTNSYPQMAVNPVNGDIYLVYNDWSEVSTDWANVYLRVSHDHGATWSAPSRVDSDTGISDQYMPSVAVTTDGTKVLVAFYDRRVNDWPIRRMAVIGDVDGLAVRFGRDFALGVSYPPVSGQDPLVGTTFMGSSDQVVADDRYFYTTWTDNRDPHLSHANQPDVRFAKIPKDLNGRDADVAVSLAVSPNPLPVVAGSETTMVVSNAGPADSPYTEATADLPADFAVTSVSTSQGACVATEAQRVSCALGTLPVGATATVLIRADAGVTPGPAQVTARVAGASGDRSAANNAATATMAVVARPGTLTSTYSSGPMPGSVTGVATAEFPIEVTENAGILDVDVRLHVSKQYPANLDVTLIAPDGTQVKGVDPRVGTELSAGSPDCAGTFTELDDQARLPVTLSPQPYTGTFRPVEPLAAMRGGPTVGTWKLRVRDTYAFSQTVIACWSIDVLKDTIHVPPPPPPPPPVPSGLYHPLPPARILDTRNGTGGFSAPVGPRSSIAVAVTGVGGVPATGVSAVVMNVTATDSSAGGYLTVFPSGTPLPPTSNLNFAAGETVPNQVTVGVGSDGKVRVYNGSGTTSVIFDVVGWYGSEGAPVGVRFNAVAPARIVDTRIGLGSGMPPLPGGLVTMDVQATGVGGVPAWDVSAVVLNVTVTEPSKGGYLTVVPTGTLRSETSSLNFAQGQTVANLVVAKVSPRGMVSFATSGVPASIVVDVMGWFGTEFTPEGARFAPVAPARLLDTRNGTGGVSSPVGPGAAVSVGVTGIGGVPATGVSAVVVNVVADAPSTGGYLTVFPSGTPRQVTSNLNFVRGQTVANLVVAKVGAGGKISIYNASGTTAVVVDVVGWYGL